MVNALVISAKTEGKLMHMQEHNVSGSLKFPNKDEEEKQKGTKNGKIVSK